ncbi:O-antigen ligase family protein [Flavobacterium luteolum]|uniref:O-antigen ligase family protein n=1 Tax=Flavobacterium luteolum TaxID=3003259 RepID=UPI00248DBF0B|nr:O-antigen ligase family protein [Flavobacterium luteolum]
MKKEDSSYIFLLLCHALLGVLIFVLPSIPKLYTLLIFFFGFYYIVKTKNRNNQVLVISAYIVGVEVLLRMTNGGTLNEFGKYSMLIFMFLGMVYSGFSKNGFLYWIFLLLLVPSIILSTVSLNFDTDMRKAIAFNILGPVCLAISSIYCYQRKISFDRLKEIMTSFALPLVTMVIYLFLYTPSIREVIRGTESNFSTSGGFGPNQVSTVLGLGMFVFFFKVLFDSKNKLIRLINIGFVFVFAFRGVITFSRGGVITAIVMILILTMVLYFQAKPNVKPKIGFIILMLFLSGLGVWAYSSFETKGMINKRYANEDAFGREKKSRLGGREVLMETEIQMFLDNPIFGVGVGKNKELRREQTGIDLPTHSEITRMLAEHGSIGIIDLLILIFTPLFVFMKDRQNILAYSFYIFWILTINHAAMRTTAPAFVYALCLLSVQLKSPEKSENSIS